MSVPSPGPDGTNGGLPVGGTTGQVLTKDSNADFDADWQNAGGGGLPAGGAIGQTIINTGPGAGTWQNAPAATPLAHAPSHGSGGSDPITNAQVPFTFPVGDGDGYVTITDDPGFVGSPVLTVGFIVGPASPNTIILRANGGIVEHYDNAGALQAYMDLGGVHAGFGIAYGDGGLLDAVTLINDGTGAGKLKLQTADQAGYFDLAMGPEILDWTRADGSTFYSDATGVSLGAVPTVDGQQVVTLAPDSLKLSDQFGAGGGGFPFQLVLTPGVGGSTAALTVRDTVLGVDALVVDGVAIGVLGATPYGQDAFIDPTVITPEQLANYQIARGWMAAA